MLEVSVLIIASIMVIIIYRWMVRVEGLESPPPNHAWKVTSIDECDNIARKFGRVGVYTYPNTCMLISSPPKN